MYIDDGKISSVIRSLTDEHLELEILSPSSTTAKIKPEKGLNFPDSNLNLPALTSNDIGNLGFIVNNATAAGLSFMHYSDDIRKLQRALSNIAKPDFGIIAKVETSDAINNLAKILLAGLDLPNFGTLIARGDLAVEMGESRLRNGCADGVPCSEQEHQQNRRTEIRILTLDPHLEIRYKDEQE
jgi:pyruvate kinase